MDLTFAYKDATFFLWIRLYLFVKSTTPEKQPPHDCAQGGFAAVEGQLQIFFQITCRHAQGIVRRRFRGTLNQYIVSIVNDTITTRFYVMVKLTQQ